MLQFMGSQRVGHELVTELVCLALLSTVSLPSSFIGFSLQPSSFTPIALKFKTELKYVFFTLLSVIY